MSTQSSTSQPSTSQPSTSQPSTSQPSTSQPSTSQPSTVVTDRGRHFLSALVDTPERALLAFDFDGTLSPMVDDPATAVISEAARVGLLRLSGRVGQLAIITGRPVATVRSLARLDDDDFGGLVVFGQYGVERLNCATGEVTSPPVSDDFRAAVTEITAVVEQVGLTDVGVEGVFIEDKGRALGVHTRRAADPEGALQRLTAPITAIAESRGLHLEPGRLVLEIRESNLSKADALRTLVRETQCTTVMMAGDDLGDVPAFDAVSDLADEGLAAACLVSGSTERPELAERADLIADGVDGVAALLGWIADQVERR